MAVPEIPKTFPFHSTQYVGDPIQCLYDVRARKGRCKVIENFEHNDENSKIVGFSLMIVEFIREESAAAFMSDEQVRFAHLGQPPANTGSTSHGDQTFISISRSAQDDSEADVFYTIRVGILVFRVALELMNITKSDDPASITDSTVREILHIYKDVDMRT